MPQRQVGGQTYSELVVFENKAALEGLQDECLFLKVLGSYPKEPLRTKS
jgi:hypothetical protein